MLSLIIPTALAAPAATLPAVPTIPVVVNTCIIPGLLCAYNGSNSVVAFLLGDFLTWAQIVFVAVGFFMFLFYGVRLVIESDEEGTQKEVKEAYSYAIAGCIIVGIGGVIIRVVGQYLYGNETNLVNVGAVKDLTNTLAVTFRMFIAIVVSAVVIVQGIRLILLQGDEGEFEKQKKKFLHSLIGISVMLVADTLVNAVLPGSRSTVLVSEIVGMVNFLLTLAGALAVLSFLVAGVFLLFSTDDSLKDRAKKTMIGAIIATIVILCCATIMNFMFTVFME